jgi:transglutaminase-like putative cysteine protease
MTQLLTAPEPTAVVPAATGQSRPAARHVPGAVVGFVATTLTVLALSVVVQAGHWLGQAIGIVGAVAVLGAVGRAVRLPRPVLALIQSFVALCIVVACCASAKAHGGFLPGGAAFRRLGHLWDFGVGDLSQSVPPDRATPTITAVLLISVAVLALVVDVLIGYGQSGVAGLCLVGLYAVPAGTLQNGWRGGFFLLPALACLLLMRHGRAARWSRWGAESVDTPAAGTGPAAVRVGLVVLSMSLLVPAALPALTGGVFNNSGIGHHVPEPLRPLDPLWVMRNLLVAKGNPALFTDQSDTHWPDEEYLREVTLDSFDGTEWRAGTRTVADLTGKLPPQVGLTPNIPTTPVSTTLTPTPAVELDYLPMPWHADSVKLAGKWRMDPRTGDVVSNLGRKQIAAGPWSIAGQDLDPETDRITGTAPVTPDLVDYLKLPALPPMIVAEAHRITAGSTGAVQMGIRLQEWFRDSKRFTYDQRPVGSGIPAIVQFLTTRHGYEEQAAATMAVMARALGIPARLAVGFTPGKADPAGDTRTISGHDAHAWPELFLPQTGWTRFEPTTASAPGAPRPLHWLTAAQKPKPQQQPRPEPQQALESPPPPPPSGGGGPHDCTATPDACKHQLQPPPTHHAHQGARRVTFLGLLVLFLITLPHTCRAVIRRRRWASITGGRSLAWLHSPAAAVHVADVAWLELRDTAVDLFHPWPTARTPRQAGRILAEEGNLTGSAAQSLATVVAAVERLRYAPHVTGPVEHLRLRAALINLRRELARPLSRLQRARAWLFPRSLRLMGREAQEWLLPRLRGLRRPTLPALRIRRKARASG